MLNYRAGYASSRAAGIAMAVYLTESDMLVLGDDARARYYAGEIDLPERTPISRLSQTIGPRFMN